MMHFTATSRRFAPRSSSFTKVCTRGLTPVLLPRPLRTGSFSTVSLRNERNHDSSSGKKSRRHWRHKPFTKFVLVYIGVTTAAYVYNLEKVPVTGRYRFMVVPKKIEKDVGVQQAAALAAQFERAGALVHPQDPRARRAFQVGKRIATASNIKGVQWQFFVVKNPDLNAFVVPGGKVFIFTGLLDRMLDDNALGFVLAHETAHVLARHPGEKMSKMALFLLPGTFVILLTNMILGMDAGYLLSGMYNVLFELPSSREMEFEADHIGLDLMATAGYDPAGSLQAMKVINAMHKGEPGFVKYFSTHPGSDERLKKLEFRLPEANHIYTRGKQRAKERAIYDNQKSLFASFEK